MHGRPVFFRHKVFVRLAREGGGFLAGAGRDEPIVVRGRSAEGEASRSVAAEARRLEQRAAWTRYLAGHQR